MLPGPSRAAISRGTATRASGPSGSTPSETGVLSSTTQSCERLTRRRRAAGAVDREHRRLRAPRSRAAPPRCRPATAAPRPAAPAPRRAPAAAPARPAEHHRGQHRRRGDRPPQPGVAPEPGEARRRGAEDPLGDPPLETRRRHPRRKAASKASRSARQAATRAAKSASRASRSAQAAVSSGPSSRSTYSPASAASGSSGRSGGSGRVAHDPRHSLRLISARRSQVRMVLSGTSKRRASSS